MSAGGARSAFGALLTIVTSPIVAVSNFVTDWWATRNWRWLVVATPAIIIGSVVLVGFLQSRFASSNGLAGAYAKQAQRALKAQEYNRAEMLYRKAAIYRPADPQLKYAQAFVLDKMGRTPEAFAVMQSISPLEDDDSGSLYTAGHLWIAQSVLEKHVDVESNPLALADAHLNAILVKNPEHVEGHRLKTNLAIGLRNPRAALKHIPFIVDKYPETRIVYARLLDLNNQKEEARQQAKRAKEFYALRFPQRLAEGKKPLSAGEWLDWASAAMIQGKFQEAIYILSRAIKAVDNKKAVRQALAGVFVRWTKKMDEVDESNVKQQLQLLGQAMQVAPDNPDVLQRVALLIGRDSDADAIAEEMLQDALVDGTAPAIVHFLLGTRAAAAGDMEAAKSHLEQAQLLNSNTPVILNNLAWVISSQGAEQLSLALDYANQAVKLQPYQANFRETRGQIHIKLENWQEGIADLEEALRKLKGKEQIHNSLATGYEALGRTDLAKLHRARAEQIRTQKEQGAGEKPDEPKNETPGA